MDSGCLKGELQEGKGHSTKGAGSGGMVEKGMKPLQKVTSVKADLYRPGNAFSLPEEPELSGLRFIVSSHPTK